MSAEQPLHPVLGRAVKDNDTCSKCGATIPEEAVPMILWPNGERSAMYVYCEKCEPAMVEKFWK